jgi:uncharacterized protein YjbJ (UPF0337 family)
MNDNIAEGRWKRIRGSAKVLRGNLSGNALDRTEGKLEKLAGVLQEKYGYARAKADEEIDRRMKEYDQKHTKSA